MNNNNRGNNNNNRRRGRGSNNRQPGGGGQQTNRIDSRARGNAPQMLEKYRKLAHDAHLNGDRVQAEYYLQFADHYFRVIADTRTRQEEQRIRRDERGEGGDASQNDGDDNDFSVESDFPTFDQPPAYSRREREDRPERPSREERDDRPERPSREERNAAPAAALAEPEEAREDGADGARGANPYEPPENPFVRPSRGTRGLRPRRDDRPARAQKAAADEGEGEALGLDPTSLPPAIARDESGAAKAGEDPAEAKPRRRTRRKPVDEGDAESLASVG